MENSRSGAVIYWLRYVRHIGNENPVSLSIDRRGMVSAASLCFVGRSDGTREDGTSDSRMSLFRLKEYTRDMSGDSQRDLAQRVATVVAARGAISNLDPVNLREAAFYTWLDLFLRLSDQAKDQYLAQVRELGSVDSR